MSRTYVHTPYNFRCLGKKRPALEHHDHRRGECHMLSLRVYRQRFTSERRFGSLRASIWHLYPCIPELSYEQYKCSFNRNLPPDYVNRYWERPARQKTRKALRAALREYNAYGATDIEAEPTRHRRQACYNWDW